jgi:hypothetical protein
VAANQVDGDEDRRDGRLYLRLPHARQRAEPVQQAAGEGVDEAASALLQVRLQLGGGGHHGGQVGWRDGNVDAGAGEPIGKHRPAAGRRFVAHK